MIIATFYYLVPILGYSILWKDKGATQMEIEVSVVLRNFLVIGPIKFSSD